jgi:hypothetical protein
MRNRGCGKTRIARGKTNAFRANAEVATSIDWVAASHRSLAKPLRRLGNSRAGNLLPDRGSCNFRRLARETGDGERRPRHKECQSPDEGRVPRVQDRSPPREDRPERLEELTPPTREALPHARRVRPRTSCARSHAWDVRAIMKSGAPASSHAIPRTAPTYRMPHRDHFYTNTQDSRVYPVAPLHDDEAWRYRPRTHGRLTTSSSRKNRRRRRFGGARSMWTRASSAISPLASARSCLPHDGGGLHECGGTGIGIGTHCAYRCSSSKRQRTATSLRQQ